MILKQLETLTSAIKKLSPKSSMAVSFRLELFLHSISHYPSILETVKKNIPEQVISFETKKMEIMKLEDVKEKEREWKELLNDVSTVKLYEKTLEDLNTIYTTDIAIPELKLSLDDIPDDLETFTSEEIEVLFSLVAD